jgi:hypothetical protein
MQIYIPKNPQNPQPYWDLPLRKREFRASSFIMLRICDEEKSVISTLASSSVDVV